MFKERKHRKAYLETFSTNETVGVGGGDQEFVNPSHASQEFCYMYFMPMYTLTGRM